MASQRVFSAVAAIFELSRHHTYLHMGIICRATTPVETIRHENINNPTIRTTWCVLLTARAWDQISRLGLSVTHSS
jgi:hypothetical protein